MSGADPIHDCIHRWHEHLRGRLDGGLDALLHEDCVFISPVVFTPQHGREVTKLYLSAASGTLGGVDAGPAGAGAIDGDGDGADGGKPKDGAFRYTKKILQGHHAMLEFETTIPGDDGAPKYANGVDIITCDDDGMIVEFKVMMRPLQAINAVHAQMRAMLERLQAG
ncbi:MAG: nuclear transport factor 2 family protein [Acidimicrobiales bacterium]